MESGEFDACNTELAHHNNEGIPGVGQGVCDVTAFRFPAGPVWPRFFTVVWIHKSCFCEKLKRHC